MNRSVADLVGRKIRRKPEPLVVAWPLPDTLMGIELELDNPPGEQRPFTDSQIFAAWERHNDASLQNGREYVLKVPLAGNELSEAIAEIMQYGPFAKTMTGSTHIHMDMLDESSSHETLRILILLVYSLESVLYAAGDKGRMYSGFCSTMESGDANIIRDAMNPEVSSDVFRARYTRNTTSNARYYGLNLIALGDYGSLEFRYFPTSSTAAELVHYIKLVQLFKKAALSVASVDDLVQIYSDEDAFNRFIASNFTDYIELFHANVNYIRAANALQKARIVCALPERISTTRVNLEAVLASKKWAGLLRKTSRKKIRLYDHQSAEALPESPNRGDVLLVGRNRIYVWDGATWRDCEMISGSSLRCVFGRQHQEMFQDLLNQVANGERILSHSQLTGINNVLTFLGEEL